MFLFVLPQQIVIGEVDLQAEREENASLERRSLAASAKWASAARWALALSLTGSHQELDAICQSETPRSTVLNRTRDAAHTLQEVLLGHHDDAIDEELKERQVSKDRWWFSLLRVVEGMCTFDRSLAPIFLVYQISLVCRNRRLSLDIRIGINLAWINSYV